MTTLGSSGSDSSRPAKNLRTTRDNALAARAHSLVLGKIRVILPALLALALPAAMSGCGGGQSSAGKAGGGAFIVLKTEPANNGRIFLNQSVKVTFSNPVDLNTANFNSVAFFVYNANGEVLSEQVVGKFQNGKNDDGEVDPRVLEFVPRLPSNDTYTDGGFKPARRYVVSLVGATNRASPTLRDVDGRPLSTDSPIQSMAFQTASGSTPQELFLDTQAGGPRVTAVQVGPMSGDKVSLNYMGAVPVQVKLTFNQPLNPASSNVPLRQDLNPANFARRDKGRVFLEYDDPELGRRRWIPTDVEMPRNDLTGAELIMRPDGVLPNAAEVRIIIEAELQDIAGESNVKDASYVRIAGTFFTEDVYEAQWDAVVLDFETAELMDPDAAFRDPVAELSNGVLKASFSFEGLQTPFDYGPTTKEIVLSTDFTTVVPKNGPPIAVTGGVFSFNNIEIPDGVTVRGVGTNPMVWLATGEVRVDGHLNVDGGDGGQVDTLNSANFPTAGGQGVCTGGNGGKASQDVQASTQRGETGYGPNQRQNGGGEGGRIACNASSGAGSGGGGGSMATKGDPDYYGDKTAPTNGNGGAGSQPSGTVPGGVSGPLVFLDDNDDNNYWGRQVDDKGVVVVGELKSPVGGAGGGGGGDRTPGNPSGNPCLGTSFINDEKGGGGGGGAGVLVIKALGRITVGPKGLVSANGGRGGGGEDAGSCRQGGGGGGGAGGMVILMSATGIDLYQHGQTWAQQDANFSVAADGNLGRNTGFGNPVRLTKYPRTTGASNAGGFGGMGVVQLMTPAGSDQDATGTPQDDNIRVLDASGQPVAPAVKTAYLFRGDLRPNPYLMPTPFSRFSQGRTRWIATGATVRRVVGSTGAGARGTTSVPVHEPLATEYGPDWVFAGLQTLGATAGYLATDDRTGLYSPPILTLSNSQQRVPIASKTPDALAVRNLRAHLVSVGDKLFPADGSYTNYRARLLNDAGTELGDYRILGHNESELYLDVRDGVLPTDAFRLEVIAKFFEVATNGNEGLGEVYEVKKGTQTLRYPVASVQIGFAFHKDPSQPNYSGTKDLNRFPQELDTFLFDLESKGATDPREALRKLHYPFVQTMVRFNLNFDYQSPDTAPGPNPVGPASARPELRFLLVPCAF